MASTFCSCVNSFLSVRTRSRFYILSGFIFCSAGDGLMEIWLSSKASLIPTVKSVPTSRLACYLLFYIGVRLLRTTLYVLTGSAYPTKFEVLAAIMFDALDILLFSGSNLAGFLPLDSRLCASYRMFSSFRNFFVISDAAAVSSFSLALVMLEPLVP